MRLLLSLETKGPEPSVAPSLSPDQQSHYLQHREGLVSKEVVRQELKVEDKTGERMRWQAGKGQNGSQCECVHLVGGS